MHVQHLLQKVCHPGIRRVSPPAGLCHADCVMADETHRAPRTGASNRYQLCFATSQYLKDWSAPLFGVCVVSNQLCASVVARWPARLVRPIRARGGRNGPLRDIIRAILW